MSSNPSSNENHFPVSAHVTGAFGKTRPIRPNEPVPKRSCFALARVEDDPTASRGTRCERMLEIERDVQLSAACSVDAFAKVILKCSEPSGTGMVSTDAAAFGGGSRGFPLKASKEARMQSYAGVLAGLAIGAVLLAGVWWFAFRPPPYPRKADWLAPRSGHEHGPSGTPHDP